MALAKMEMEWQRYSAKKQSDGAKWEAVGSMAAAAIGLW